MLSSHQNVPAGVVLQGGGALGAFECGVMQRLYKEGLRPDVISGVSIGAINAACLAADPLRSTATMEKLWNTLKMDDFWRPFLWCVGNPRFYTMRWDVLNMMNWTSLCSVEPMRRLLGELIDFDYLNGGDAPKLILSAVNVLTGDLEYFQNFGGKHIRAEHILASGSLPPGLPMTTINGETYWDGGLVDNTPLKPVIDQLRLLHGPAKHLYLVQLYSKVGPIPRNLLEVQDRMTELRFCYRIAADVRQAEKINDYLRVLRLVRDFAPDEQKTVIDRLLSRHQVIEFKMIRFGNNGPVSAATDFTESAIDQRIAAGCVAAQEFLETEISEEPDAIGELLAKLEKAGGMKSGTTPAEGAVPPQPATVTFRPVEPKPV